MSTLAVRQLLSGGRSDGTPIARQEGSTLRLGQMRERIAHNARRLAERRPARALLVCDSSAEFVIGLLSLATLGCRAVLPPNAQVGTLRTFADAADVLVTDRALPGVDKVFVLEQSGASLAPYDVENIPIDFFTSGSTGEMKRVEKSLVTLEREGATLDRMWGASIGDAAVFGMVSHQHIFGLAFKVIWPLLAGRAFMAETHVVWESLLRDLTPGAVIVTSPAHLTRLGGLPPLAATRQPSLIFTAGAPLPSEATADTQAIFGVAPVEIFGSTETSALAWRRGVSANPVWQVLPGIEAWADSDGLLELRSPFVVGDGCCKLSDRVEFVEEGGFRFLGRADSVVKIEGRRVNIIELERRITALGWIKAAIIVPLPEPRMTLGVVATLSEAGAALLEERGKFRFIRMLRRELLDTHDPAVLPRHWRFVDRIPTDPMGKRRLRDIASLLDTPS